jgi:hypothetical protein
MKEILVELGLPNANSSLYPHYDEEVDLIIVESRVHREWAYGINIDSLLILDIDVDRTLAHFELIIPRQRWKVAPDLHKPRALHEVSIRFAKESIQHKYFELPVVVKTDRKRSCVYILFGSEQQAASWVALSDPCLALVDQNHLLAFFVDLSGLQLAI